VKRKLRKLAIHTAIKKLREERGMAQFELADKCKVHKTAVSQWERGHCQPRGGTLPLVAAALGVTIDELYQAAES
jgi:transcriptional regulator with XRE-family HTH domain